MGLLNAPRILVVTDEPLLRHMVARLLVGEGYVALTAEGGEADFDRFAGAPLALVLVNTYLPGLSGSEVVARVSAAFPGIPVLHLEDGASASFDLEHLLHSVRALTHAERRRVARTEAARG